MLPGLDARRSDPGKLPRLPGPDAAAAEAAEGAGTLRRACGVFGPL